jgi:hypothetical protein
VLNLEMCSEAMRSSEFADAPERHLSVTIFMHSVAVRSWKFGDSLEGHEKATVN